MNVARKATFGRDFSSALVEGLSCKNLGPCLSHGHARSQEKDLKEVFFECGVSDNSKKEQHLGGLTQRQHSIAEFIRKQLKLDVHIGQGKTCADLCELVRPLFGLVE